MLYRFTSSACPRVRDCFTGQSRGDNCPQAPSYSVGWFRAMVAYSPSEKVKHRLETS